MGQTMSYADGFCGQVGDTRSPHLEQTINHAPSGEEKQELPRLLGVKEVDASRATLKLEKEQTPIALHELELEIPDESAEIEVAAASDEVPQDAVLVPEAVQAEDSTVRQEDSSQQQDRENRQKTERSAALKEQKKTERAEAKSQILPFLQQHGFDSVKSKKTWLWRLYYPLHVAVEKNDLDALNRLLKAGADVQKKNHRGQTPLQLATRLNKGGNRTAMLQALTTATSKANKAREKKRKTPQHKPKPEAAAASSSWEPVVESGTR